MKGTADGVASLCVTLDLSKMSTWFAVKVLLFEHPFMNLVMCVCCLLLVGGARLQ